jgi:hypothetical protein
MANSRSFVGPEMTAIVNGWIDPFSPARWIGEAFAGDVADACQHLPAASIAVRRAKVTRILK